MTTTYTVTYFDARGRAEPIRLLLSYAGVPFEDRGMSPDEWAKAKADSPLGQLPFLTERRDGETRVIPESMAILRHLARVHGLEGKTEDERVAADVAAEASLDARNAHSALRFSPAWSDESAKAKFAVEVAPTYLARLDQLLANRTWYAASAPLWADIYVYDTLDRLVAHWPSILASWPRLAAFHARVAALPQLSRYLATRRPA